MSSKFEEKNCIMGGSITLDPPVHGDFAPQTPNTFGLNPANQLVIGYHCFSFLNQVHVVVLIPNSLRVFSTKSI